MSPQVTIEGGGPGEQYNLAAHTVTLRDQATGQLFTMDLGQSDVHIDRALANFITGYSNGEMAADKVAAPIVVPNASNYFFQFQPDNALATIDGTQVAAGGNYPEITPALSNTRYSTKGYTLGAKIPLELIQNQDVPLKIQMTSMRMCMDRLMLNREVRVKTLAFATASYDASLVTTLGATQKWNGGSAADPVTDIKTLYQASLMPPTHMVMSRQTWDVFVTNPAVQKYVAFKSGAAPIPAKGQYAEWAALLDLPIPIIAEAKAKTAGTTAYPYVWNTNVALLRIPPGEQVNENDITTFKTFRWTGTDGQKIDQMTGPGVPSVQGGFIVRSFYDYSQFGGPRGSLRIVVTHNDGETITGGPGAASLVGGLIVNAYQ